MCMPRCIGNVFRRQTVGSSGDGGEGMHQLKGSSVTYGDTVLRTPYNIFRYLLETSSLTGTILYITYSSTKVLIIIEPCDPKTLNTYNNNNNNNNNNIQFLAQSIHQHYNKPCPHYLVPMCIAPANTATLNHGWILPCTHPTLPPHLHIYIHNLPTSIPKRRQRNHYYSSPITTVFGSWTAAPYEPSPPRRTLTNFLP